MPCALITKKEGGAAKGARRKACQSAKRESENCRKDRGKGCRRRLDGAQATGWKLSGTKYLILTITENGYGKRTDIDEYRLTARGAQGVNNLKATSKVGKSSSILRVDEQSELMVISQFGKIIRCDTNTIRAAGRATQGVATSTSSPTTRSPRRHHPTRRAKWRRRVHARQRCSNPNKGCPTLRPSAAADFALGWE